MEKVGIFLIFPSRFGFGIFPWILLVFGLVSVSRFSVIDITNQHHRGAEGKADGLLGSVVPETAGLRRRSRPEATAGLRDGQRSSV